MDPILVRFGTVTPVTFREYDEKYLYTDLTLTGRFCGEIYVEDYDKERYPDEEVLRNEIRANSTALFQEALNDLPPGKTLVNGSMHPLEECFARKLAENGITATTCVKSWARIPESEEEFCKMMDFEEAGRKLRELYDTDLKEEPSERIPGTFRVRYAPIGEDNGCFSSEKQYYTPGEKVLVRCRFMSSDWKEEFFADAGEFQVRWEEPFYLITFVMPDRDTDVLLRPQLRRFTRPDDFFLGGNENPWEE